MDLPDPASNHAARATDALSEGVRIDAWAWAVRLFKTRTLAAAACRKEQVFVNGVRCRPSRRVRIGDEVSVRQGSLLRRYAVLELLSKRVGAGEVPRYLADLTPPEEIAEALAVARLNRESAPQREQGAGRPTKRDRRDLDELIADAADERGDFEAFARALKRPR